MNTRELLKTLSNAHGISGHEENIRALITKEIEPYVDDIRVDVMGNLIATQENGFRGPRVMLAAHMDEIGLMIKYIDDKGFAYFTTIGGWFDQTLLNMRFVLHGEFGDIYGVIGSKAPHMMNAEERKKMIEAKDMYIDFGAMTKEGAEAMGIGIGTPCTPDITFQPLGNDRVTGKAFDNRAGCVMLIETLKRTHGIKNVVVNAVFTVQEEVGCKGAKTSAYKLNPAVAIATDVTIPGDHPGVTHKESTVDLGKGPAVIMVEGGGRGTMAPPKVINWLKKAAGKDTPYQLEVGEGGVTDGMVIQLTREGIPTGVVSVPCRYIHSAVSVMSMDDLENSICLLTDAIKIVDEHF